MSGQKHLVGVRGGNGRAVKGARAHSHPDDSAIFGENSAIGYVSFDEHARVAQVNARAAELLGVRRRALLGMPLPAVLDAEEVPKFLKHLHRCRGGQEMRISTELNMGREAGKQIAVELSSTCSMVNGRRLFPTAVIDLRRSKQQLQMLVEAKELAEHLFEFVPSPVAALNEHMVIEATNSAFREKFHAHSQELHGHTLSELDLVSWEKNEFLPMLRRVITQDQPLRNFPVECRLRISGQPLALMANAMRIVPRPNARPLVLLMFEDVTQRRRHEQERETMVAELQEMNVQLEARVRDRTVELNTANQQLKSLSQRVIEAQESERRYLARELHDEVGQVLTGLNMLLHRASDDATKEVRGEIREARRIVANLLQQVRQMSLDLRPAVLDDLGLFVAVRAHIDTFSKRTGVRVQLECEGIAEHNMSPELKITAFRVVQESLTNVARHARAKTAAVALHGSSSKLVVQITDAGRGFDPEERTDGTGLKGMRERVELSGGQLDVQSASGRGTRVSVQLPLHVRKGATA